MSLDTAEDVVVDAFRALAKDEVTRRLSALTNEGDEPVPAVRTTYGYPIPFVLIPDTELPVMAIWRADETERQTTMRHLDSRVTLNFVYTTTGAPLEKLGPRWPILKTVWRTLLDAIRDGEVGPDAGRVEVLKGVGIIGIDDETASAAFDFSVGDDSSTFPQFRGRLSVLLREVPEDDLVDLRELLVRINRPDGNPALQPQVTVLARTEAGALADEGSGDPFDPDSEDADP